MGSAVSIAQTGPQVANAPRTTYNADVTRALATGVLTLSRPQAGSTVTFDANDYVLIDFRWLIDQWVSLVRLGRTLKIIFSNGSVIELLHFFSYDSPPEDHTTGSVSDAADASGDLLVQTRDSEFLSAKEFAQSFPVKPLGEGGAGERVAKGGGPYLIFQLSGQDGAPNDPGSQTTPFLPNVVPVPGLPEFPAPPSGPISPSQPPLVTNNSPVITGAVAGGHTMEDASPATVSGTIDFTDVDLNDAHVVLVIPGGNGYLGTFEAKVINDSTGDNAGQVKWTYSSNNTALQFLKDGQQLVQFYTVMIVDGQGGSTSQLVTITITGTNDAAVITGPTAGTVVEAGGVANGMPGIPVATGDLNSTDIDNPNDTWTAVPTATLSTGGYGTYTLTAAGVWTYTLDDSNPAVQALNVGSTLTDSFLATTVDGTAQIVTITIQGTNDSPVAADDVATVVEGGAVTTASVLGNDTDPDNSLTAATITGFTQGANGTVVDNGDGTFTYTHDGSETTSDSFTYTIDDGAGGSATATVHITALFNLTFQ